MTTNASLYDAIDESKRNYYIYYQQPEDDNEKHQRNYKSNVDVVEHHGGSLFNDPVLIKHEKDEDIKNSIPAKTEEEYAEIVKQKEMGVGILKRSDHNRYGPLLTSICDQYGYGMDVYPKTLSAGHDMLEIMRGAETSQ